MDAWTVVIVLVSGGVIYAGWTWWIHRGKRAKDAAVQNYREHD